ncbi:hypothetical protein K7X08_015823 [Anisodus acutangulus]|uniref:Uncharacterized protein n=1 Tax=Anisodus acutangulus TaxID=402998 RepID=A0A9Q1LED3_9SOLA|nr:hypothetical protein K7X08_015823 [Anisodus acutangulus]
MVAMAKRGRPRKDKQQTTIVATVGSAISARIIAQTLEQSNSQKVITPPAMQIRPIELNLSGTKGSSSKATKALQLGESSAQTLDRGGVSRSGPNPTSVTNETVQSEVFTPPEEVNVDQHPKQNWAALFKGNRSVDNGLTLAYITPDLIEGKVLVQLEKDEVEAETMK